ncbi:MAG: NnrS family protein [Caldimonas sp.]
MALLRIAEPRPRLENRFALFDLGFRPFYLLASIFAALSVPLWALQFSGLLSRPYLTGAVWHAHEMLFGFTLAVIVGFLFTAGSNWSGQPTPKGWWLAGIAALWTLARILVLTPFAWAAAAVNVAVPLTAAIALAIPFVKSGNRRNYFFVGLLCLMAVACALVHLSQMGVLPPVSGLAIQVALDIVLFIMAVMAGRVIPMFTNNGVPGAGASKHPTLEKAALGSVLVLMVADALALHGAALATVATVAMAAHLGRWLRWHPWNTRKAPMVWVLHLAYLWVPIHLLLRALAESGIVAASAATHALTVGAAGGLVIGMMTRTARGHTARPVCADGVDVACYVLVAAAAAVRVALPLAAPAQTLPAVWASALLWSAGFALYAIRYWPVLTRPRLDGRPG